VLKLAVSLRQCKIHAPKLLTRQGDRRTAQPRPRTQDRADPYDVMIAGTALCRGLVMVTSNGDEFARIDGLILEDWRTRENDGERRFFTSRRPCMMTTPITPPLPGGKISGAIKIGNEPGPIPMPQRHQSVEMRPPRVRVRCSCVRRTRLNPVYE
jgi:hypothetical protein